MWGHSVLFLWVNTSLCALRKCVEAKNQSGLGCGQKHISVCGAVVHSEVICHIVSKVPICLCRIHLVVKNFRSLFLSYIVDRSLLGSHGVQRDPGPVNESHNRGGCASLNNQCGTRAFYYTGLLNVLTVSVSNVSHATACEGRPLNAMVRMSPLNLTVRMSTFNVRVRVILVNVSMNPFNVRVNLRMSTFNVRVRVILVNVSMNPFNVRVKLSAFIARASLI